MDPIRLAVHLHVYYVDMWPRIKRYLSHLEGQPYHLYVTMTEEHPELTDQIREFHPDSTFYLVENRGYDVGPFIYFLHQINLQDYDLILKIHTKNSTSKQLVWLNHRLLNRAWWSRLLYTSLLGSPAQVRRNLNTFRTEPDVGMLGSMHLITSHARDLAQVKDGVQHIMQKLTRSSWQFRFIAGTMFIARSSLLQPIKDNFRLEDFDPPIGSMLDGSLAHVIERILGCIVTAQGYKIKGCAWNPLFELFSILQIIWDFLYKKKITTSNRLIIKICRIPIINRKLRG